MLHSADNLDLVWYKAPSGLVLQHCKNNTSNSAQNINLYCKYIMSRPLRLEFNCALYHILLETLDANLSKGMRQLNGVFTQSFNRNHHRVGQLFQGRYKSILVDADNYLLALSRYIVLNPVRAHMVEHHGDWPWSSYLLQLPTKLHRPGWRQISYCYNFQNKGKWLSGNIRNL